MKSNFKKIISLLLVVMMLALVMLQAVSCGTTPPDNPPSGDTPGGDNPGGDTPGNTDKPSMSNYTVQVKSYGGLPLSDVRLYIHEENNLNSSITARATTDKNGIATFELATSDSYYIELENYPLGYIADDLYKMDATGKSIMLMSKPIDPEEEEIWDVKKYELGDIIHDFTITDLDGVEHTVSDVLKEKSLLVLNFWYKGCSNCDAEFPYLSSAYDKYSDKMELFAINDYAGETLQDALNHKVVDKNGNVIETNFPKFFLDVASDPDLFLLDKFGSTGYPTTVMIDRYGVICMIEIGGIPSEKPFVKAFEHFTADNYQQRLIEKIDDLNPAILPNVDMPSSDEISEVLDNGLLDITYKADDSDEYAWPYILTEKNGVQCVKNSNFDQDSSYAALLTTVYLEAGDALLFDYFSSTDSGDILVITVDGKDIYTISGNNTTNSWNTCCTWVAETSGYYDVNFVYAKDFAGYEGDDAVYISNLRVVGADDVPVETYIFRFAAVNGENGYTYAEIVYNENDGYYHVGTADGPLLLVDMLGRYTQFEMLQQVRKTIFERMYAITNKDQNDMPIFTVGGKNVFKSFETYGTYSSFSEIYGCVPVTKDLKEMLVAYANLFRNDVGKPQDDNLWLQLCCYYSAYGPDVKQLEDPIKGLAPFSALTAVEGDNTVTYNKIIVPRGLLYKFVPSKSGVYRITSKANSLTGIVGWIFIAQTDDAHNEWAEAGGRESNAFTLTTNEMHFERYSPNLLIIDHYSIECPECGTDVTVAENATSATCSNTECGAAITDMSGITAVYAIDRKNISMTAYLEEGETYYIDLAYHTVEELGSFDFSLEYVGESFDRFISSSPAAHTMEIFPDGTFGKIIHGGIDAQLCHLDECEACAYTAETLGDPVGTKYYHHIKSQGYMGATGYFGGELKLTRKTPLAGFSALSTDIIADIWVGTEVLEDGTTYYYNVTLDDNGTGYIAITTFAGESIIDLEISSYEISGAEVTVNFKNVSGSAETISGTQTLTYTEGELGSLIYADFYMPTSIFSANGLASLIDSKTQIDDGSLVYIFGEYRDAVREYVANKMLNEEGFPERQGCIPVDEELAEILQYVMDVSVFEGVYQSWLKLCYYYETLGE